MNKSKFLISIFIISLALVGAGCFGGQENGLEENGEKSDSSDSAVTTKYAEREDFSKKLNNKILAALKETAKQLGGWQYYPGTGIDTDEMIIHRINSPASVGNENGGNMTVTVYKNYAAMEKEMQRGTGYRCDDCLSKPPVYSILSSSIGKLCCYNDTTDDAKKVRSWDNETCVYNTDYLINIIARQYATSADYPSGLSYCSSKQYIDAFWNNLNK